MNSKNTTKTAYSSSQAISYDSLRFEDIAGKKIHEVELSCLLDVSRKIDKTSRALEVGCGTGRLLIEMVNRGYSVDGADGSASMLMEARNKLDSLGDNSRLFECGAHSIPVDDGVYDFTYCIRLLNQTESEQYALSVVNEMMRATKPDGYCLIEFVNYYRPRIGLNSRATTRLKPAQVLKQVEENNGKFESWKGAFFFGMAAYKRCPSVLLPAFQSLDHVLSNLFPRMCSRVYLEIRNKSSK